MKALRFDRTGSLDALTLTTMPIPDPDPGEVRVRVYAAAVNPSDVKNVLGRFPYTTVPRTPGRDFAGVITDGPDELIGREVWGSGKELGFTRDGSHAEYLTVPAAGVTAKPANLTFAEAAACGVPYITAAEALERADVHVGTKVVIIGQGAVGRAAYALARVRHARVMTAVRRPKQASALRNLGISAATLGDPATFADSVQAALGDHADVVFDTTGAWLPPAIPALAPGGRVCVIAAPADGYATIPVLDLYRRGAAVIGVNSLLHDTVATAQMLNSLRPSFESGALPRPENLVENPLADAVDTYRHVNSGHPEKFVLTPF